MKIPARAQSLVDRAVMTGAQSVLSYAVLTPMTDALSLDYRVAGGVFLGGALFSLLTNVARGGISGRLSKEG
jgi:hypothetical protein